MGREPNRQTGPALSLYCLHPTWLISQALVNKLGSATPAPAPAPSFVCLAPAPDSLFPYRCSPVLPPPPPALCPCAAVHACMCPVPMCCDTCMHECALCPCAVIHACMCRVPMCCDACSVPCSHVR